MTSSEWAAIVTGVAIVIAKDKTSDEINFLSALFTQLGDTLATLAVEPPKCLCQKNKSDRSLSTDQTE